MTSGYSSPALFKFAFGIRNKLGALIDAVWKWEEVDNTLSRVGGTCVERLAAATQRDCICGGLWPAWASTILANNNVDAAFFWHTLYMCLHDGRREDKSIMVLVDRRGGRSLSGTQRCLRKCSGSSQVRANHFYSHR